MGGRKRECVRTCRRQSESHRQLECQRNFGRIGTYCVDMQKWESIQDFDRIRAESVHLGHIHSRDNFGLRAVLTAHS